MIFDKIFNRKATPAPLAEKPAFLENAEGHLVPVDKIPAEKLREDAAVRECAALLNHLASHVGDTKKAVFARLDAYDQTDKMTDYHTLYSFDGQWKIIASTFKRREFNDNLRKAYMLMMACIERWARESGQKSEKLRQLAAQRVDFDHMTAHEKNSIFELKKIQSEEEEWQKAMRLLDAAVDITRIKRRVNLYRRNPAGKYEIVQINFYRAED